MEGTTYGDVPLNAELKLEVWDSPNSAGVITDAIRCLKLGLDRGLKGTLVAPSSYFMKSPPQQIHDDIALQPGRGVHPRRGQRDARRDRGADCPKAEQGDQAAEGEGEGGGRHPVTAGEPTQRAGLEAPHRRAPRAFSRLTERTAVTAYRSTAWVLGRTPEAATRGVLGVLSEGSYLLWPARRRVSDLNFSRVLRTTPDDPAVRRLARRAYRTYARYLTELMRLPTMPIDDIVAMTEAEGVERLAADWRASGKGLIVIAPHVGNNEVAAAGIAHMGLPLTGLADHSAFPELLELLTHQREAWSVRTIMWRNIREIFGVLRRKEILVLLIDWGYREDGIPVVLFDRWTTLPAGPATIAAKTGTRPAALRQADGRRPLSPQRRAGHRAGVELAGRPPARDPGDGRRP